MGLEGRMRLLKKAHLQRAALKLELVSELQRQHVLSAWFTALLLSLLLFQLNDPFLDCLSCLSLLACTNKDDGLIFSVKSKIKSMSSLKSFIRNQNVSQGCCSPNISSHGANFFLLGIHHHFYQDAADGVWPAEVCYCAMCDVQAVVGGRECYGAGDARKPVEGHVTSCSQAADHVCGVKGLN